MKRIRKRGKELQKRGGLKKSIEKIGEFAISIRKIELKMGSMMMRVLK